METTPPKLQFYHNWNNKLDNICFSTIRLYNGNKYFPGATFDVELITKGQTIPKGTAQALIVYKIKINELTEYYARMDTSYGREETINIIRTMYKNKPNVNTDTADFAIVLFKKIKTAQDPVKVLDTKKTMLEQCPKCDAAWKWQEVQAQCCECCGYPNIDAENNY